VAVILPTVELAEDERSTGEATGAVSTSSDNCTLLLLLLMLLLLLLLLLPVFKLLEDIITPGSESLKNDKGIV